jgi:hypothetical protein
MIKPSSSLVLCTAGLTSGGSSGILSRSAKTLLGTVNGLFCASAAGAGRTSNTASVNNVVRIMCFIQSYGDRAEDHSRPKWRALVALQVFTLLDHRFWGTSMPLDLTLVVVAESQARTVSARMHPLPCEDD